ncbi:hypothetical protein QTO34_018185 [Cnephaeus nilssonii]|uniref:Uncharacterized protein n=1 Tax=Cnephaeus nilssonii TaxID=3371016 RepID=A0AA40LMU8_CNENI|nr:hypothetical protein QTO34_018185 [Eptesicus nilssonii]
MTQTLSSRLAQSATPATLSPAPCTSCWPNRGRSGVMMLHNHHHHHHHHHTTTIIIIITTTIIITITTTIIISSTTTTTISLTKTMPPLMGVRGLTRTQGRVASPGPRTQPHPDPGAHGLTRTRDLASPGPRGAWPHPDPGARGLSQTQGHVASPGPGIQLHPDPGAHGLARTRDLASPGPRGTWPHPDPGARGLSQTQGRVASPGPGTQPHPDPGAHDLTPPLPPPPFPHTDEQAPLAPADGAEQLEMAPAVDASRASAISGFEWRLLPNRPSGAGGGGEALRGDQGWHCHSHALMELSYQDQQRVPVGTSPAAASPQAPQVCTFLYAPKPRGYLEDSSATRAGHGGFLISAAGKPPGPAKPGIAASLVGQWQEKASVLSKVHREPRRHILEMITCKSRRGKSTLF